MTQVLDEVQLSKLVPSVFATGGANNTSSKYGFIPTIEVVRGMRKAGFYPVMAAQSKSRIDGRENFVKHLMRFRHESNLSNERKEGMLSEIVLVNSHDGTTSYQLRAGIYRLVCSNGMIVGDEICCRRIKHQGSVIEKVVEAANDLIEISPISVEKALEWKQIPLSREAQYAYAETASTLRWQEGEELVHAGKLLEPRRTEDTNNDLWTTFNVIQENLVRGGIRYRTENNQRQKTRPVNSVGENVRLNTALWALTEKMAQLAK